MEEYLGGEGDTGMARPDGMSVMGSRRHLAGGEEVLGLRGRTKQPKQMSG